MKQIIEKIGVGETPAPLVLGPSLPAGVEETPKKPAVLDQKTLMRNIGGTGTKLFGGQIYEEYNPKLSGQAGFKVYDEMRRSDAQVNAAIMAIELPIRSTFWNVNAGATWDGGEDMVTEADEEIQKFVENCLFEYMDNSWDDLLRQILQMVTFGFSAFEKVYGFHGDKIILKKLSERLPRTVMRWDRNEDGKFGLTQMLGMNDEGKPLTVSIPAEKMLVFTFRREGENIEGISVLRSAYKHWYIKDTLYKLDAVKHERQAIGVPVIKLPDVHKSSDIDDAETILLNLRATEKSFVVLPGEKWDFHFAQMWTGATSETEKSIAHHDTKILQNILASFLDLGKGGNGGSYALSEDQSSLFLLSLSALANQICDVFNRQIIPELVRLNFDVAENQTLPKLTFQKLGEVKYTELASALSTLTSSGLITTDEETEDHIRNLYDLPKKVRDVMGEDELDDLNNADAMDADAEQAAVDDAAYVDENGLGGDGDVVPVGGAGDGDIEEEMKKLDAEFQKFSNVRNAEMVALFSEIPLDLSAPLLFRAPVDDKTREAISRGLIEYWKTRKKNDSGETIDEENKRHAQKVRETTSRISGILDNYRNENDAIRSKIEIIKNGKGDKKTKSAQIKALRAQIREKMNAKNADTKWLRTIRREALNSRKATRELIIERRKAIASEVARINSEVKSKVSTRAAAVRSLANMIRNNIAKISGLSSGATSKEQRANLKALKNAVKSENMQLRKAAEKIRDEIRYIRMDGKNAVADTKNVAKMSEVARENGFTDAYEMANFFNYRDIFSIENFTKL